MRVTRPSVSIGSVALLAAAITQVLYLCQPTSFLNDHVLTVDDTYYYLEVAQNLAHRGLSTFDGLHRTSGVQLLWTVILVALAKVVALFDGDRMQFVRAALAVSVALNLTTGLLLRQLGRRMHSIAVGEASAVFWSFILISSGTTLTGMEFSLHLAVTAGTLLALQRVVVMSPPARHLAMLGLMATLNFWTRLDSALFSGLVLLVPTVQILRTRRAPLVHLTAVWGMPLVGALLYIAVCYRMAGTPLPISGLVKSWYAGQHFAGSPWWLAAAGHALWWLKIQAQPVTTVVSSAIGLESTSAFRVQVFLALGVLLAILWALRRTGRGSAQDRQLAAALLLLWGASALHALLVVGSIGHFAHVTNHYYGWSLLAWCVVAALLLDVHLRRLSDRQRRLVLGVALALAVLFQGVSAGNRLRQRPDMTALRNTRTDLIDWITRHVPSGEPIAAWNAGQFGYFLARPVVNLDGLVNNRLFLDSLRSGEPVQDYLRRQGIRYVVDYNDPDLTMPYQAAWDRSRLFRGQIPWTEVDRLQERIAGDKTIYVLRLKDRPADSLLAINRRPSASGR